MSNFWSGSVDNAISGSTPFGIYDTDTEYQTDGPKIAGWCAKRLGYPIVDVELTRKLALDKIWKIKKSSKSKSLAKKILNKHANL